MTGRLRRRRPAGYTLVAIMVFLTVLTISVLVVVPTVYKVMQREREEELLFRGKQYALAIINFQKRQGRPPLFLKELMKTQPRSARKLFKEPMCDCMDWGLIHPGELFPRPRVNPDETDGGSDFNPTAPRTSTSSPFPSTYGSAPSSGTSTGARPGSGIGTGTDQGNGAGFSNSPLFQDKGPEATQGPIIGVYSKLHKKGLRTFKGYEYYDEWGFIAGQNNDDLPDLTQLLGQRRQLPGSPQVAPPQPPRR